MSIPLQLSRYVPRIGSSTPGATTAPIRQPFELENVSTEEAKKFRVYASTLSGASSIELGFSEGDPAPGYVLTVSGSGVFYGIVTIDADTGDITSRSLGNGATLPEDTATNYCVEIGSYAVTDGSLVVANVRYGAISGQSCRNWNATSDNGEPKYTYQFL